MPNDRARLSGGQAAIESYLASAHRSVWKARELAEARVDQGLADDLMQVQTFLSQLMRSELLKGSTRRSRTTRRT